MPPPPKPGLPGWPAVLEAAQQEAAQELRGLLADASTSGASPHDVPDPLKARTDYRATAEGIVFDFSRSDDAPPEVVGPE